MPTDPKQPEVEPRHCDEYIHDHEAPMCLRWFLFVNRLPAMDRALLIQNVRAPALYARFRDERVRVVMASRMGDVGITRDLNADVGYEMRVNVEDLTDFRGSR